MGVGVYFFFRAAGHAATWANMVSNRPLPRAAGAHPVVLECVIDLADTINLLDDTHWPNLKAIHRTLVSSPGQVGPQGLFDDPRSPDLGRNYDDYIVMNAYIAAVREMRPVTSVIAAFMEGDAIGPKSWLFDQSHVCISALSPAIIEFRDRTDFPLTSPSS